MQTSGLRLDDGAAALRGGYSGPVIKPGDGAGSPLVLHIAGAKGFPQMPPAGPKLAAQEIAKVRTWIDQGATWPGAERSENGKGPGSLRSSTHWSFQPIRKPAPPSVSTAEWVRSPIDAFILARLEQEKIALSPEASRSVLLRRLSLDLTGLPPTPQELDGFASDQRSNAYERQVDRLLASPHFGEKWARYWLDLARYGDSDGYEKDFFRPWAWRYRDWVVNAFNDDMPFDEFTIEQIAGDLLPKATPAQKTATGFHRNTLTNREGGIADAQFRFEETVDRASTVGVVWLGLTIGCAQCHDHKYDPISQRDFYKTFAFFDNVEEADIYAPLPGQLGPYLQRHREYEEKRRELLARYQVPELQAAWEQKLRETMVNPGKWGDWDLAWDCVKKLTVGGDGAKILQIPADKRTPHEQEVLTNHLVRYYHFAVGPKKYEELGFKKLDQELAELKASYPQLAEAMIIEESPERHPSYLRVRGDYKNPGVEVQPAVLSVLPQLPAGSRPTRLDLAKWLVSGQNPLTARVAVNRIWQELFGQGIVKSSDDFGTRGDRPSHPELLDWLASEFRDNGWSQKRLIREIVLSATYRQSSKALPELERSDPENRLLARQSRLRLPAELIRDATLAVSGLLDPEIGGPSVRPPQPAGVVDLAYGKGWETKWEESKGAARYRRGLYIQFQRATPYPQLMNFDAPKSNVPVCRRERSNTSLQALNLLNDPVFIEAAGALAYHIIGEAPQDPSGRLNYGFRLAIGREPKEREERTLLSYYQRQKSIFVQDPKSAAALAPQASNQNDSIELASWTVVASVLFNLDEFITRE
jgi:hypothetical protein